VLSWAIINGDMYWSFFVNNIDLSLELNWIDIDELEIINRNLLHLVYYMIDLSPVQIIFDAQHN